MKFWIALAVLLLSTPVSAQPRPGAFTTIVATSSSATAVCVGCPIGTTSPAANSGLTAATLALPPVGTPGTTTNKLYNSGGGLFFGSATTFNVGGFLRVAPSAVVGSNSISSGGTGTQSFTVANTSAGTTNVSQIIVSANNSNLSLSQLSSTFTTSGINTANGSVLIAGGSGGLAMATTDAGGTMRFITNQGATSTPMLTFHPSGGASLGTAVDPGAGVFSANTLLVNSTAFASLPAATNGTVQWCADCAPASNPCTGTSTGSFAFRMNGAWKCI